MLARGRRRRPDGNAEVVAPGPAADGWATTGCPTGACSPSGPERPSCTSPAATGPEPAASNEPADPRGTCSSTAPTSTSSAAGRPSRGWIRRIAEDWHGRVQVAGGHRLPERDGGSPPDGATLVVAEPFAGRLTAFDLGAPDGTLWQPRTADGLGLTASVSTGRRSGPRLRTSAHTGDPDACLPAPACASWTAARSRTGSRPTCPASCAGGPEGRHLFLPATSSRASISW
ncbi:hypothetical protein HBB16_09220 [Pseudonocardia sp. MCCB 268]|nr:hypothetical protein [Pseudonocardia cytotoxica]